MKYTPVLSLLIASSAVISAAPLPQDNSAEASSSSVYLYNHSGATLYYEAVGAPNEGGSNNTGIVAQGSLGNGGEVSLPVPPFNQQGYAYHLSPDADMSAFYLAEVTISNQNGGLDEIFYDFSTQGAATDPFINLPRSIVPATDYGSPYNCSRIHCKAGGSRCNYPRTKSCPNGDNLSIYIGAVN